MPVSAMWGLTPFCVALGKSLLLWLLVTLCNPADVPVGIVATQIKSRGVQVLWQEGKANEAGYWELAGGLQGSAGLRWAGTPAPWCRGSVLQLALAGSGPSGGGGGRWISVCRTVTSPLLLNVVKLERLLI